MPTDGLSSLNGSIFSELGSDEVEYGERFHEEGSSKTGAGGWGVDLSPVDESPTAQTSRYGHAGSVDELKWGTGGSVVRVYLSVGGCARACVRGVRACVRGVRACVARVRACVAAPWSGGYGYAWLA